MPPHLTSMWDFLLGEAIIKVLKPLQWVPVPLWDLCPTPLISLGSVCFTGAHEGQKASRLTD